MNQPIDYPQPPRAKPSALVLAVVEEFKDGRSSGELTANNLEAERLDVEAMIREVMLWQEERQ